MTLFLSLGYKRHVIDEVTSVSTTHRCVILLFHFGQGYMQFHCPSSMPRNAQKECPECHRMVRSDHLERHQRTHSRQVKKTEIVKAKEKRSLDFLDIIRNTLATEDLGNIVHGFFRTDCYANNLDDEAVFQHFDLIGNFACECGRNRDCVHHHAHFLGKWTHAQRPKDILSKVFTKKKAYSMKQLRGGNGSLEDKIKRIKHFVHTAVYIQTVYGWHKKKSHRNLYTFATLEDSKRFLAALYKDWMWAQVTYMRELFKRADRIEAALDKGTLTLEKKSQLEDSWLKTQEKLGLLEKKWGEEHHYTDAEIAADLDTFLFACKHNKLEINYDS